MSCKISYFCLFVLLFVASVANESFALEPIDSIIASVDGEPVTATEFTEYLKKQAVFNPAAQSGAGQKRMLRDYIMLKVLDREAEAVGATVGEVEVSSYLNEVIRQNQATKEQFKEVLAGRGIEWSAYLEQVRMDILKSRIISARVRSKIAVMDEDIQRRVEAQPELLSSKSTVWLLQRIFPAKNHASTTEAVLAAEQFIQSLASLNERERKSVFLSTFPATQASDLGQISDGDLREEISQGINGVVAGQSSEPVRLGADVAVFLVLGKSQAGQLGAASKERVREQIFQEKFETAMKVFLEEELPRRYHIEFVN